MILEKDTIKKLSQQALKKLINRRHPEYKDRLDHWMFCQATYEGGRAWFEDNIFKYMKEGETEFEDRKKRAYRFNHTREVVDLVNKYIFKSPVSRSSDAPEELKEFWKSATINGRKIDYLMRVASQHSSVFGRPWIFVDNNIPQGVKTQKDQKTSGGRIYAYVVSPIDVLDLAWGDDGGLDWIMVRETRRDDEDPLNSSGDVSQEFRIWTRQSWALFKINKKGAKGDYNVELVDVQAHNLGLVPAIPLDDRDTENPYVCPSLIEDIAYLDRAVGNYLSNLDAIVQDQTFSQLVIPSQALVGVGESDNGEDSVAERDRASIIAMGTKRIFTYDGQSPKGPQYISPDAAQANLILAVINKIIHEIYHSVGMAGERTKQDNATGIDNSSGVAKAYDFERMNAMLGNKAKSLEAAENKISEIVLAWANKDAPKDELVSYPVEFDVRSLYDEFDIATKFKAIEGPKEIRREQMIRLIEKLYPELPKDLLDSIKKEIKNDWLEDPIIEGQPANGNLPPKVLPKHDNRQGQNNKGKDSGASDSTSK